MKKIHKKSTVTLKNPIKICNWSEQSERDTVRGVQILAGAVYIYMYGGTCAIIVSACHTYVMGAELG